MTFAFDTSGEIVLPYPNLHPHPRGIRWSDLSPFEQGYVEAVFASLRSGDLGYLPLSAIRKELAFSNLAPETLKTIRRDCADFVSDCYPADINPMKDDGQAFWKGRLAGKPAVCKMPIESGLRLGLKHFPRLKPVLNDAGKVVFA